MTQGLANKQKADLSSQNSPPKGFQLQRSRPALEQYREKSRNEQVLFLDKSNSRPTDLQESREHIRTTLDKARSKSFLTSETPHNEERLVRDELTNELYLTLTCAVVLNCHEKMQYVLLDFDNNLTKDALIDSRAYVSAIAQNDLDTIKQKTQTTPSKSTTLPNFKYKSQMASYKNRYQQPHLNLTLERTHLLSIPSY